MRIRGWTRAAILVAAGCLLSCSDDDSSGNDVGNDSGLDVGGDVSDADGGGDADSTEPVRPIELTGNYDLVSVTMAGNTLTTENQNVDGVQFRAEGSLSIAADGDYVFFMRVFEDDVGGDPTTSTGTWEVIGGDTLRTVADDDAENPVDFAYSYDSGSRVLTLDGPDFIGDYVWEK